MERDHAFDLLDRGVRISHYKFYKDRLCYSSGDSLEELRKKYPLEGKAHISPYGKNDVARGKWNDLWGVYSDKYGIISLEV